MMDKNCMMMDEQMSNERKEKLEFTAEHHKEALKMLSWDKAVLEQQEKYGEGYRFVSVDKDNNKTYTYDIFTAGRYDGILFSINKDGSLDFCSIPKKMLSGDDLMNLKYKREYDDGFRYLVVDGDTKRYCFYEHQMKDYPGIKWNIREDGSLDAYEILNCDDPTDPDYYECEGGELINLIKDIIGKDGWTGYCQGNIIKYVVRARDKNGVEDLEKAKVYIDFLINGGLKNENRQ